MKLSLREKFIAIVDNDRLKKSDAIILLEGDGLFRVKKAIELFERKLADKIVFSGGINKLEYGSYPLEYILPELMKYSFRESNLIFDEKSMHTLDQAMNVLEIAINKGWNRILLVASHYHQYRAYLTFLKQVLIKEYKIELINAPANDLLWFEELKWGKRFDLLDSEFERIEKYSQMDHLATYKEAIEYQKWKEKQV